MPTCRLGSGSPQICESLESRVVRAPSFFGKANSNDGRLISRMATALAHFSPMDGGPEKKRIAIMGMAVTGPRMRLLPRLKIQQQAA